MVFDKDEYWRRRKAGLPGTPRPSKNTGRRYTVWETDAMSYHKKVMEAAKRGEITEAQAKAELLDASKAAADNLQSTGAPEILVAVVEQLIIHGSYEGLQRAAEEEKKENDTKS